MGTILAPGATHLYEKPGALEAVARQARAWFEQYLASTNNRTASSRVGRDWMWQNGMSKVPQGGDP